MFFLVNIYILLTSFRLVVLKLSDIGEDEREEQVKAGAQNLILAAVQGFKTRQRLHFVKVCHCVDYIEYYLELHANSIYISFV